MWTYKKEYTEKYFCNECGAIWFSDSKFVDLCEYCESEHIYSITIKSRDKDKAAKLKKDIKALKEDIFNKELQLETLPWIK